MIRFIRDTENFPTDFITGFAPYPVEEKGQENYMAGANIFSHVGIATGCQNEEAAWAFTKCMQRMDLNTLLWQDICPLGREQKSVIWYHWCLALRKKQPR